MPNRDPNYRQSAKEAARGAYAGAQETHKLEDRGRSYVPGYGNPSERNMGSVGTTSTGLTPKPKWDAQFTPTLGGSAQTANPSTPLAAPQLGQLNISPAAGTPAIDHRTMSPAAPPATQSGFASTTPEQVKQIGNQYSPHAAAPAITPPTSIVPQGNPNALQPGQGWQNPNVSPVGATSLTAPDGIHERVAEGHIASEFRPNVYTGPGESPNGVRHETPAPTQHAIAPEIESQLVTEMPGLMDEKSPENRAFVQVFNTTRDHAQAMQAARAASVNTAMNAAPPPIQQI